MTNKLSILRLIDPVLSNVARGYTNETMIGDQIFPVVSVEKEAGRIPYWGKDIFKIWATERALRAKSNMMDGGWLDTTTYSTTEHDIAFPLDYREIKESFVNAEVHAVEIVMNAINLRREKMQADLAFGLGTYGNDNKETLLNKFFNDPTVDFIHEIHIKKSKLASIIGQDPNTLIMGAEVWNKLKFHPLLKAYITVAPNLFQAVASIPKLSEILEIPNILIGKSRFTNDGETLDYIWGNNILLAYITPPSGLNRTPYEPCFGYTLRVNGNPFSDKYDDENGKIHNVRTTDNFDVKVVGAESGYLINCPINPDDYGAYTS
jgi:hypothetical protein